MAEHPVHAVGVVIPAHQEEDLVGACLRSLRTAARSLEAECPDVDVSVVVVLDRCSDRTGALARAAGATTIEVDAGNVGAARRAGVEHVATLHSHLRPEHVWVAGTDADTRVPRDWLSTQLRVATAGGRLVLGAVVPDGRDLAPQVLAAWTRRHPPAPVGRHVHGANLGVRLDAYLEVGGFPPEPLHEDQLLVAALRAVGVDAHPGARVTTSGRLHGRAPDGFSGYLRGLVAEQAGPTAAAT